MNLKNYLFLLVLLLAAGVRAQAPSGNAYPKREFRAAWIQAVNGQFRGIPTEKLKQTLVGQLNSLQGAGINAIIFQVRPEADALYASQHEPWSRFLTGTQGQMPSPMWDPMLFMIEECHKRNMEFHAWINPYRVKTSLKNQLAPTHIYQKHPVVESIFAGLRPAVVGLLASAALVLMNVENFGSPTEDTYTFVISIIIFLIAFIGTRKYKANPILMIIACGIAGLLLY